MQDLHFTYRYSYGLDPRCVPVVAAPPELPLLVHDAHRALRNGAAMAPVLDFSMAQIGEIEQAIGRIEELIDESEDLEPWRALTIPTGVSSVVRSFAQQIVVACRHALDYDWRPIGPLGARITRSTEDDDDAVFTYDASGAIGLSLPRMCLGSVEDALAAMGEMMDFALATGLDVLVCPEIWGARVIEPEWLP